MFRFNVQGVNAAINHTTPEMGGERMLKAVIVKSSAASGTSENFVVALDSELGSDYDTTLVSQDFSGVTSFVSADINVPLAPGDKLRVTFANTEHKTVSAIIVVE